MTGFVPLTLVAIDYTNGDASSIMNEDIEALDGLFAATKKSNGVLIQGNVALLYLQFSPDGAVLGTNLSVHEIISQCGALIVIIATENDASSTRVALGDMGTWQANLVVTSKRKGGCFPRFIRNVFDSMAAGVPIALAWNQWAPQMPPQYLPNDLPIAPETACIMKVGGLKFPV